METRKKSKFWGLLFLCLSMLCIINAFVTYLYRVSFYSFFLVIGVLLLTLSLFELYILNKHNFNLFKFISKLFHAATVLILLSFILIEGIIIASATKKDIQTPDYIIILGAGLWNDVPSLTLVQRLNASLDIIKNNPKADIILSGGQGPGETISEAEAMRTYLINCGVSPDRLIKEDKSTNTLENLKFSKKILKDLNPNENITVTIVTSNFHMYRAKLLAKRLGLKAYGHPAPIKAALAPTYFIREYMAVIKSVFFDKP